MKNRKNGTGSGLRISLRIARLLLLSTAAYGSEDYIPHEWTVRPTGSFEEPGQVELELKVTIDTAYCIERAHTGNYDLPGTTYRLDIITTGGLRVLGDTTITLTLSGGPVETVRFMVDVPDDTVSSVAVKERIETPWGVHYSSRGKSYFVTTGDTCDYRGLTPGLSAAEIRARMPKDTALYRVRVDLRDPETFAAAREWSDRTGQPLTPTEDSGFYEVLLPRKEIESLGKDGMNYQVLDSLPPMPEEPASIKVKERRVGPKSRRKPRPKQSGKLDTDCAVYVTCVDGEDDWGRIYTNQLITIYLSFWNGTGESIYGVDNGFRIYSPDGALQNPCDLALS